VAEPLSTRQSIVDDDRPFVVEQLQRWPTLRVTRIFDMVEGRGIPVSPRTIRERVARRRPRKPRKAFLRTWADGRAGPDRLGLHRQRERRRDPGSPVDVRHHPVLSRAIWAEACFSMDAATKRRGQLQETFLAFGVDVDCWLQENRDAGAAVARCSVTGSMAPTSLPPASTSSSGRLRGNHEPRRSSRPRTRR